MSFAVGSLVKARGREWVVLPETKDDLLMVRPLGGTDDETTGILLALETVEPAQFDLPNPSLIGDYRSCRLLRDAVRLHGFGTDPRPGSPVGGLAPALGGRRVEQVLQLAQIGKAQELLRDVSLLALALDGGEALDHVRQHLFD